MSSAITNYGVYLHGEGGDNTNTGSVWHSANRTAEAITIYGDSSANTSASAYGVTASKYSTLSTQWGYNSFHLLASGLKDSADLANKPGGGIRVTGIGSTGPTYGMNGIWWSWADALAKDGPITFAGYSKDTAGSLQSAGIYLGENNAVMNARFGAMSSLTNTTAKTYTTASGAVVDFTTSNSNITLSSPKFVFFEFDNGTAASGYFFDTNGDVTLQPWGDAFTANQNGTHWRFGRVQMPSRVKNFTLGKLTDATSSTPYYSVWYANINASGSIKFFSSGQFNTTSSLILNTTLAASGTNTPNAGILFKSADRIQLGIGNNLSTSGSDITLWADGDSSGLGAIYLDGTDVLNSGGGAITLGGGADDGGSGDMAGRVAGDGRPDGYAGSVQSWWYTVNGQVVGVWLRSGYQLLSGGGPISIAGQDNPVVGYDSSGVAMEPGMVFSGTGKISIYGKTATGCTNNWHRAIMTGWGGSTYLVSNSTATDAVYILSLIHI